MANPIRRIVSSSKDDTATVLSIGVQWESLRAAYFGHYGKTEKADNCFLKAQMYELELEGFLERANKGQGFPPKSGISFPSLSVSSCYQLSNADSNTKLALGRAIFSHYYSRYVTPIKSGGAERFPQTRRPIRPTTASDKDSAPVNSFGRSHRRHCSCKSQ